MPDTPKITIIKEFQYRGAAEEWSNTYNFNGTQPTTDADWKALALAIYASEKTLYTARCVLVRAYGYEPGNLHSIAQIDFTVGTPLRPPGTLSGAVGDPMAGDQAAWIRAKVGVSSTGKKVYIRKYYHDGMVENGGDPVMVAGWQSNAQAHAVLMLGGSLPGGATWCSPSGAAGTLPSHSNWPTVRTLKRRGKRP